MSIMVYEQKVVCRQCHGPGQITHIYFTGDGQLYLESHCPVCNLEGKDWLDIAEKIGECLAQDHKLPGLSLGSSTIQ